jgi:hypothetical protein
MDCHIPTVTREETHQGELEVVVVDLEDLGEGEEVEDVEALWHLSRTVSRNYWWIRKYRS